jgi:hypothetical protein
MRVRIPVRGQTPANPTQFCSRKRHPPGFDTFFEQERLCGRGGMARNEIRGSIAHQRLFLKWVCIFLHAQKCFTDKSCEKERSSEVK